MDPLHIVLLGVIILIGYQLFLALTQGRIYGRNNWLSYSTDWIYVKQQPYTFYTTLAIYSIGLIGAILVLIVSA